MKLCSVDLPPQQHTGFLTYINYIHTFQIRLFLSTLKLDRGVPDIAENTVCKLDSKYCSSFMNNRLMEKQKKMASNVLYLVFFVSFFIDRRFVYFGYDPNSQNHSLNLWGKKSLNVVMSLEVLGVIFFHGIGLGSDFVNKINLSDCFRNKSNRWHCFRDKINWWDCFCDKIYWWDWFSDKNIDFVTESHAIV